MLKITVFFIIFFVSTFSKGEDVFYNINNKKILHKVSDKFLSISIDPAVLLAGVNLSDVSLTLTNHLSPAYIRLAGPSTQFVKYLDDEEAVLPYREEGDKIYITPSMWFGINEWFNLASLTPVFGINDRETEKGVWDPKSTLPLLEMSDKFGVTCYWQLGYDCSNRTTVQYVDDLNILRQTLNGYPEHNETWKIVGSDFSSCSSDDMSSSSFDRYIRDLDENADAVMWQSSLIPKAELGLTKAALWTSIPKDTLPVTFSSAIDWALKVGKAATLEYDVIFREPRLLEFTHDTPVYWFSFLHKKLMGSNVLEIQTISQNPDLALFAHCTKKQNDFVRSGAITVMVVNNGSELNSANLRLANILLEKSMEIQSYFLTPSNESTSKVFLNDQLLTMDILRRTDDILKPKLRRAKVRAHISLEIPPQTIGFFVLTGAKYTLCTNNAEDLNTLLEEINKDQVVSLSSEEAEFNIEQRSQNNEGVGSRVPSGEKMTLQSIKNNILNELEQDKNYYERLLKKPQSSKNFLEKDNMEHASDKRQMLHTHLRAFVEKAKKKALQPGVTSRSEKLPLYRPPANNMHLTLQEVEEILKQRARAKAAEKNIRLTSSELDMLVDKATLIIPKRLFSKRDINRALLEEKANFYSNNVFTQEMFEQLAKGSKPFPRYGRSEGYVGRRKREINKQLHLKSRMEESKKYLLRGNERLRRSPYYRAKKSKRDINLDLLKKRTEPMSPFRGSKIVVQPNMKPETSGFREKARDKYIPLNLDGEPSMDFLDELMRYEERVFLDITMPKDAFTDVDSLDIEKIEEEFFRKSSKASNKPTKAVFGSSFLKPQYHADSIKFPKTKTKLQRLNSEDYLQFLKSSMEDLGGFGDEEEPCVDEFGMWSSTPKHGKEKDFMDLLGLRSGKIDKEEKAHLLCSEFGDLTFSGNLDYGFKRRKRDTNTVTKEKLRAMKKNIKSEVRKLKQQLKEDKTKYIKEKHMEKAELKKHKNNSRVKMDKKYRKNNIQVVPKSELEKNITINEIIENANISENTIPPPLEHNLAKRSLMSNAINNMFGQYKPLTTGLQPWRPVDILNLQKSYFPMLPVYSWVQDQNMKNSLFKQKYLSPYGLRKRRYIVDNSVNPYQNEILDEEYFRKHKNENGEVKWLYEKGDIKDGKHTFSGKDHHLEVTTYEGSHPSDTTTSAVNNNTKIEGHGGNDHKMKTAKTIEVMPHSTPTVKNNENTEAHHKVIENIYPEKLTYLEKVLGKKKVKPIEDFFEDVIDKFKEMNKKIKHFFKNLF